VAKAIFAKPMGTLKKLTQAVGNQTQMQHLFDR